VARFTIAVEPEVEVWVRLEAAEQKKSVTRYIAELLKQRRISDEQAMLRDAGESLPKREDT